MGITGGGSQLEKLGARTIPVASTGPSHQLPRWKSHTCEVAGVPGCSPLLADTAACIEDPVVKSNIVSSLTTRVSSCASGNLDLYVIDNVLTTR
jgi:hypothetical protein